MPINANGKLRVKGVGQIGPILTDFISVWDTNLGDGQPTIQLPLGGASSNYNFDVNWGDGTTDNVQGSGGLITGYYSHTYATGGIYTVTITGTIEGWSFGAFGGDSAKLTSITNVGPLKLGNEGSYFQGCSNLTTIGGTFDLTGTTNFNSMFENCTSLTSVNGISGWDTSAVTTMSSMFGNATSFNQNINSWNMSSVTVINAMFENATLFNGNISGWDVSSVTEMSGVFYNATSFNQDISGWDVSSVTDMTSMFDSTPFNQDISGWDTSAVTNMSYMFYNATTFNQPLNSWDVSSVTNMGGMFNDATVFNQSLNSWNTAAVTDMNEMFSGAIAFNQDISGWDVSNVTYMDSFMYGKSTADYDYYDNLLNSWSLLTLQNGVNWDMGSIEYTSAGAAARASIISNYLWNIIDGGLAA